jgi:glutamyl-tRNA reductase
MKLTLFGISHHNCGIAEREKLNLSHDEQCTILREVHALPDLVEALVLNTCNRLEFYFYGSKQFDPKAHADGVISKLRPAGLQTWRQKYYEQHGISVVRHLFRVAAGLDSQMIGENQIISQLKSAYATALECHTSKFLFHKLMHNAFHVGKAVRSETQMNCGAASVPLAAVEMAKKAMSPGSGKVMVIGAGESAELAASYLAKFGVKELLIANRSGESAQAIIERLRTGRVIRLDEVAGQMANVDVVIASTSAAEPVVKLAEAETYIAARNRPLTIIDIAVPRDVEEGIGRLKNVKLFNIDDLNKIAEENKNRRAQTIPSAEAIVEEHVKEFSTWLDSLSIVPVIRDLTQHLVETARGEARRYAASVGGVKPDELEVFAESLAKKILHGPIQFLKSTGDDEPTFEQLQAMSLINRVFLEKKT